MKNFVKKLHENVHCFLLVKTPKVLHEVFHEVFHKVLHDVFHRVVYEVFQVSTTFFTKIFTKFFTKFFTFSPCERHVFYNVLVAETFLKMLFGVPKARVLWGFRSSR